MGSFTAQILVGRGCVHHGGIIISHSLLLSENSRPAWILRSQDGCPDGAPVRGRIVWIPTVEHMLEDGLLMIAAHVLRNERVREGIRRNFRQRENRRAELYEDVAKVDRENLYTLCRSIENRCKLVVTVLTDSSIERQLRVLEHYTWDVEVCRVAFRREYSAWSGKTIIDGFLEVKRGG